jgi:hypothetical protein
MMRGVRLTAVCFLTLVLVWVMAGRGDDTGPPHPDTDTIDCVYPFSLQFKVKALEQIATPTLLFIGICIVLTAPLAVAYRQSPRPPVPLGGASLLYALMSLQR